MRLACLSIALSALAVLLPGAGGGQPLRRVGEAGITVALPSAWHIPPPPLAGLIPAVTDPRVRVVAVSAPFHFDDRGCQIAAWDFPRSAVAIVVVEWTTRLGRHARWATRPTRFTPNTLELLPAPAIECFDGPGGSAQFADHGRRLGVYLLAGRDAKPALVARARAVLDTLRVSQR